MIGKARGRQKASEPTKPEADTSNEVSNTSRPAALIVATRVAPPGDRWPLIGEA
jgi:hypothetical protein